MVETLCGKRRICIRRAKALPELLGATVVYDWV
jgi:hypothetical protein